MEEASNLWEVVQDGPSEGGVTPEAAEAASEDVGPVTGWGNLGTNQGDLVENPQVKHNFRLLPGDNTRDILQNFTLPTLRGSTYGKSFASRGPLLRELPPWEQPCGPPRCRFLGGGRGLGGLVGVVDAGVTVSWRQTKAIYPILSLD